MSRTGAELVTDLRVELDEFVAQNWEDPPLLSFLNRAVNKVASVLRLQRTGYLEKIVLQSDSALTVYGVEYDPSTELALAAGATSLTLPEDCVELKAIVPISQTQRDNGMSFYLTTVDSPEFRQSRRRTQSDADQVYYCVFVGTTTLQIAPPLKEAVNIEIQYVAMPARVDASSVIDGIPEYAYEAILKYAQYLALWSIKHEDAQVAYGHWLQEKKDLTEMLNQREGDDVTIAHGVFDDDDYYDYLDSGW